MIIGLSSYRRTVDRLTARHNLATAAVEKEVGEQVRIATDLTATVQAQQIVQGIAQGIQQRVHARVADVVTRCLEAVFDDPYEFQIRFDRKRGKTEARMVFARDGMELDEPLDEIGGGVVDVAALALRLTSLLLSRPKPRRLLVLDEPFKNVNSKRYRQRVKRMVERLAEDLDVQFVIVSQMEDFQVGKVVELE